VQKDDAFGGALEALHEALEQAAAARSAQRCDHGRQPRQPKQRRSGERFDAVAWGEWGCVIHDRKPTARGNAVGSVSTHFLHASTRRLEISGENLAEAASRSGEIGG
jgi:hypothetical protein